MMISWGGDQTAKSRFLSFIDYSLCLGRGGGTLESFVFREGRLTLCSYGILLRLDLLNFVAGAKQLLVVVPMEEMNACDKLPSQLRVKSVFVSDMTSEGLMDLPGRQRLVAASNGHPSCCIREENEDGVEK